VTRKYPLDPLRRVREQAVDQKVRELSDSLRHVESAQSEVERTERRQRELESAVEATTAAERRRLWQGELTAADLARQAAWGVAKAIDRAEHARAVEHAHAHKAAAEVETTRRQGELAQAKASAELVAKHHQRWQRSEATQRMARDDEDAELSHQSQLTRRGAP
jgi:hypothetical protein